MLEVIPGILEKDFSEIERKIELVKPFVKKIHIDVIDGQFAPNTTFLDPTRFTKYASDLILEAHLMVKEPINYLDSFAKSGFKRFLGQVEQMSSQEDFVALGQALGEIGLALDLDTPLEVIKVPFADLDDILLMAVKAGHSGQFFDRKVLAKIKSLRDKTQIPIEIDGGIDEGTIVEAKACGAKRFVTTSYIFNQENPHLQWERLLSHLNASV